MCQRQSWAKVVPSGGGGTCSQNPRPNIWTNTWKSLPVLQNFKPYPQHQWPHVLCNFNKFRSTIIHAYAFWPGSCIALWLLPASQQAFRFPSILPNGNELEVFFFFFLIVSLKIFAWAIAGKGGLGFRQDLWEIKIGWSHFHSLKVLV